MAQFMFLLRNESFKWEDYSPENFQEILARFDTWYKSIMDDGKFVGSGKLKDGEGMTLRFKQNKTIIDGVYCETKDAVAGVFIVEAENYQEAIKLARDCPMLPLGGSVEVRAMEIEFHNV